MLLSVPAYILCGLHVNISLVAAFFSAYDCHFAGVQRQNVCLFQMEVYNCSRFLSTAHIAIKAKFVLGIYGFTSVAAVYCDTSNS